MSLTFSTPPSQPARILDFDIESRPLGWYGGIFVHQEVTVISSAWTDDPEGTMQTNYLTKRAGSAERMFKAFVKRYNEADIVAGHYIRGFDLPHINWGLAEFGLPILGPKLTHDTKGALVKMHGVSKSQENLASVFGTPSPKIGMNMGNWRSANRLEQDGIEYSIERCEGDVLQNIEMRAELIKRGLLGAPKIWRPGSGNMPRYTP